MINLQGGKISEKSYHQIDDSGYTWLYNQLGIYALYKGKQWCELEYLIAHPSLFVQYDGMRKIKVIFDTLDYDVLDLGIAESQFGALNFVKN